MQIQTHTYTQIVHDSSFYWKHSPEGEWELKMNISNMWTVNFLMFKLGMATHSVFLPGESLSPWTEEPGGLQSIGSQSQTGMKQLNMHPHCILYPIFPLTCDFSSWYKLGRYSFCVNQMLVLICFKDLPVSSFWSMSFLQYMLSFDVHFHYHLVLNAFFSCSNLKDLLHLGIS